MPPVDDAVARDPGGADGRPPLLHPRSLIWRWRPAILGGRGNRIEGAGLGGLRVRLATAYWGTSSGNRITVGPNFRTGGLAIRVDGDGNRITIGAHVRFTGRIELRGSGLSVRIGDRCDVKRTEISAFVADVAVGQDCLVAAGTRLRSGDVHTITDRATGTRINAPKPIVVGDRVWLGAKVTLLKGATVPDGCVVGWGSIVTRAFDEPDCVLAGAPARVVRRGIAWAR